MTTETKPFPSLLEISSKTAPAYLELLIRFQIAQSRKGGVEPDIDATMEMLETAISFLEDINEGGAIEAVS